YGRSGSTASTSTCARCRGRSRTMTDVTAGGTVTRMIDAPPDLVFRAWTEGEHLAKWYAPEGFGVARAEADARQGGAYSIVMQGPDGAEYPLWGTYNDV